MKHTRTLLSALALSLAMGSALATDRDAPADLSTATVADKVESAVVGAVDATREGIHTGATAAVRGAERGVQAAGHGIETGARAVGRFVQRVGQKIQDIAS
jgi:hypothetical protein